MSRFMRMMLIPAARSDQPLTSICRYTCIMDAQGRREARLSRRRERERRNRALESTEERETRLARRRVGTELCELHSLLPSEKKLYNAEGSADSAQSLRTYVRTSTYIYVCTAAYARPSANSLRLAPQCLHLCST